LIDMLVLNATFSYIYC